VAINRAIPVTPEAMFAPPQEILYFDGDGVVADCAATEPFLMFSCSARTSDIVGFDDTMGIFDGVDVAVHVPQELNPGLASSSASSFVFSRLGTCSTGGTNYAAYVSLPIVLATLPLSQDRTLHTGQPGSCTSDEKSTLSLCSRKQGRPHVPPILPIHAAVPASMQVDDGPSLAKSVAQLRIDSARRRSAERWTQIRIHSARRREEDEKGNFPSCRSSRSARRRVEDEKGNSPSCQSSRSDSYRTPREALPGRARRDGASNAQDMRAGASQRAIDPTVTSAVSTTSESQQKPWRSSTSRYSGSAPRSGARVKC
jgi:hypothetical protein